MKKQDSYLFSKRAHLSFIMACAVKRLFPDCIECINKVTEEGFYYDFYFNSSKKLTMDSLKAISLEMSKIIAAKSNVKYLEVLMAEAAEYFKDNSFKQEILKTFKDNKTVKLIQYDNVIDICDFDELHSISELKDIHWKLNSISGAYWKGNENNPMLYRINGYAFEKEAELNEFIEIRKEAEARDHRKIGRELELFTSSQLVGKGLPMLLPKGAMMRMVLERFIVDEELKRGYLSVYTPPIASLKLYETSGHWQFYNQSMYPPIEIGDEKYMLRPTSCPHHIMLYKDKPKSYRELPMRIGEIASLFRREQSGELSGLVRVMNFTLADAHIFCTPEQVKAEFIGAVNLIKHVMKCLGIEGQLSFRASLKDDNNDKYFDDQKMWEHNEQLLLNILDEMKLEYETAYGEAAFYGPKLDIQMKNVYGKEETVFTVQIDSYLPLKFELSYIDNNGEKAVPLIIHRSSIGCIERTLAFLIEYYKGVFPCWIAPVQVRILTINERQIEYAAHIESMLRQNNIRIETDYRDESIGKKIREGRLMKIPYLIIVGDNELLNNTISVRNRDSGEQNNIKVNEFAENLQKEIKEYSLELNANKPIDLYASWNMLHL